MNISDIIIPERVDCDVDVSSKKRALEKISNIIVGEEDTSLAVKEVCDSLLARERLGSTGIGYGVAIPHGRLKNTNKTIAAFIRLHNGIDYDALDNQEVDMLFALLVPENSTEEHLQLLAELAQMFSQEGFRNKIRETTDKKTLFNLLQNWKQYCQ